jgi:hypothetical protein
MSPTNIGVIIGGVAAAAWLAVPLAHADDQFINTLANQGSTGDRGQLISDAHQACDSYGSPGFAGLMMQIEGQGFNAGQAQNVMIGGMRAYCPQQVPF